ncbi:MAG TPA: UbiA family prenyltransferase [Chloroflexota bacterium]
MKNVLVHLRLHFQLLLAPVFLWGWLIAGGGLSWSVVLAFVSLHVFLYAGATAFNSYYDRDEGPVGGLERPPPVEPALLPVSLGMKAFGALLAALVNWPFLIVYLAFALLSLAYSHPRIRLKASTWGSVLTVALGQGVLAFLGAWAAVRGELWSALSAQGALGALAAALLILAVYPLTQLYQADEDRARGDRTIAVAWGARRCFVFAELCGVVGGAAMLATLWQAFGLLDVLLVGLGLSAELVAIAWWARCYDPLQTLANYRHVMRLNTLSAGGLSLYLLGRLAASAPVWR